VGDLLAGVVRSGTVLGLDGRPAPGADVTVYTVSWSTAGYTEVARATAATGPVGTFPGTFLEVPESSEDEEIAHVLRPD
jgi:hypothetical protein